MVSDTAKLEQHAVKVLDARLDEAVRIVHLDVVEQFPRIAAQWSSASTSEYFNEAVAGSREGVARLCRWSEGL